MKRILTVLIVSSLMLPLMPPRSGAANGVNAGIVEEDIEYTPEDQTVHVGQPIRIVNKDPFNHKSRVTLQRQDGKLGKIALKDHVDKPGATYTFTLQQPGTYEIRCMIHDGMTATIHVIK